VTGGWRKLHNEELPDLYSLRSIITKVKSRRMGWAGRVARMRTERNAYRVLVGSQEGNRRPVHSWVVETGWGGMSWIGLDQDNSCEHGNESDGSIKYRKFLSGCTTNGEGLSYMELALVWGI
jgi:hypothetical protein